MIIVNGKDDYCQFKVELKTFVDIKYKQKKGWSALKQSILFLKKGMVGFRE